MEDEGEAVELRFLPPGTPRDRLVGLLRDGALEPVGRLVASSNVSLLCTVSLPDDGGDGEPLVASCVYKPVRGERPLWDFPDGTLAAREVAAYEVSEASGWGLVPPTLLRDGPYGDGMVQLWLDVDDAADPLELVRGADPRLRRHALFDVVVNNADRTVGHLLPTADGAIRAVDHGVCFHAEPKLRTVLWAWRGSPIDDGERADLEALRSALGGALGKTLAGLLAADEVAATAARLDELLAAGTFPEPDPERRAIPWPWY